MIQRDHHLIAISESRLGKQHITEQTLLKWEQHLDQLYAEFPSESKPSLPVDTVAFSKCLMLIDERAEVTIINMDNQSFRNS